MDTTADKKALRAAEQLLAEAIDCLRLIDQIIDDKNTLLAAKERLLKETIERLTQRDTM